MWLADVAIAVRTAAATCMLLVIEHWQRPSEAAAALALGVHGDGKRIVSRTLPLLRPGEGEGVRHTRARLRWLAGPLLTPLRTLRSPGESPLHMHPVLLGTSNPPDAHLPVLGGLVGPPIPSCRAPGAYHRTRKTLFFLFAASPAPSPIPSSPTPNAH